jgi:predicted NBD/HSP70 family sugar kinase
MKTTGDQQLVKRINRSVLLRLIRAWPGLSRAQLASQSGLTKSTVSTAVRELLEEGWLMEANTVAGGTASRQGRPSTPLQINPGSRGLIGVEVAVDCLRAVGVNLLGDVLWSAEEPLGRIEPAAVCAQVAGLAAKAHAELSTRGFLLSGMGVGLPGGFEDASGMLRFAPNLGWRNVHFAPLVAQALERAGLPDVPMHIQNEADAAALSEYEFAHDESADTLIFVTCDVGVGAGIVLDDRLYTGAQGLAGEIGHTILQLDGPPCSCGRRGCAETFIGARALEAELAAQGHMRRAGRCLGVLVQNLWTAFNPAVIVLGGRSIARHPALADHAGQALQAYAANAGMPAPVLRSARYGLLAAAVGAAAMALHRYMRPVPTRSAYVPEAPAATPAPKQARAGRLQPTLA